VALADRDRVGPAGLVALADQVGPEALEDMNLVAPAVPEDTGPADLADRADRASLGDLVGLADMSLADLVGLAAPNRAGRDLVDRAARDLSQGRAQMGRNLAHPGRAALNRALRRRNLPDQDLTRAHLDPMRAHLHRTRDHLPEPTHPGVATHLPVPTHPGEAIHPAEATHPGEATHPEEATREADTEGVKPHYREFSSQSSGFGHATRNCLGAPSKTVCITAPANAGSPASQVRFLRGGSNAGRPAQLFLTPSAA
jgi:hypothetical protein